VGPLVTADPYAKAFEILADALDDLTERRDRGDRLVDFVILTVTGEDTSGDHISNGLAVDASQRLGTLRWFTLRAEHWLVGTWAGEDDAD